MTEPTRMTKGEREDLLKLVRGREKVMKTAASRRAAEMLSEFEQQISKIHHYDNDEVWAALKKEAEANMADLSKRLSARCDELGIPEEFRPSFSIGWNHRGYNGIDERRQELRKVAKAEIAAVEQKAREEIEIMAVNAQSEILSHGLTSEAATAFLSNLTAIEKLMPMLDAGSVNMKIEDRHKKRNQEYN